MKVCVANLIGVLYTWEIYYTPGNTLGKINQDDLEQLLRYFRVLRDRFKIYSGCYKLPGPGAGTMLFLLRH